jgi:Cellulose binding domain/Bacterial Ig domain
MSMRWRSVAGVVAVVVTAAAGTAAVVPASPAMAASGCKVGYTVVSQWPTGFQASVQVTNLGDPVNNWTLQFDFPEATQRVTQGWAASWSQNGVRASAASLPWNAALGTGATVDVGFLGSSGQPAPTPTAFTLNGVPCTGTPVTESPSPAPSSKPPTVTLTNPRPNPDIAWGYDVGLAASASDPDGVVTKVEFYGNGKLLFTDTAAPYEFLYTVRDAPGGLTLSAKAYDNDGLTATSQSISAFVFSPAETLTGVVEAGAEAGCWSLVTDTTRYLLVGDDQTRFTPGSRIQVRGTTRPSLITTCQQGTPFLVYSAQPA